MSGPRRRRTARRRASLPLLVLAWLLLLAACGGSGEGGGPDGSDQDGGASEGPLTVRIGAALSETGDYEVEGGDTRQGYETWARWANEVYGGIKIGDDLYQVEVVYRDDESDAGRSAQLVRQLIHSDNVDFLLGPYSSTIAASASAVAEDNDVIMVTGSGTSDSIYDRGFENLFLVATLASDYTRSGVEALAARGGVETAVLAHQEGLFPETVVAGAVQHLAANGIEVLAVEAYPAPRAYPDNSAEIAEAVSAIMEGFNGLDADLFVGGGYYEDAKLFVNTAHATGFNPAGMLITVGPSNPLLVKELGSRLDGVLGPTQWEPSMKYRGPYFGSARDYADYYEDLWGEPPTYQAASATAAALALHVAIESAASLEAEDVRAALRELSADTFYGPVGFDERGVNAGKPMGTVQVQDGSIRVVAPAEAADSGLRDMRWPPQPG